MAVSGLIGVNNNQIVHGQTLLVTFTLTNPAGGTVVNVLRVEPYSLCSSTTPPAAQNGTPQVPIGGSTTLAASATANSTFSTTWNQSLFAPQKPGATALAYTVGAVAYLSDGSTVQASTTVTVSPLTSDGNVPTTMPNNGNLRFDSNVESGLLGVLSFPQ